MKLSLKIICSLVFLCSCSLLKKDDEDSSSQDDTGASSSGQGTTDDQLKLTAPSSFEDGDTFDPATDHFTLVWSVVEGALSYEIAVGSTAGATDILGWYDVGNTTSVSTSTLSLPEAGMFYATVRVVGSDGTKSSATNGDGWQHLICPEHWVRVPGNTTASLGGGVYVSGTRTKHDGSSRTLSDFCVMKYEMKLAIGGIIQPTGDVANEIDLSIAANEVEFLGGRIVTTSSFGGGAGLLVEAVSSAEGRPWVRIERSAFDDIAGAEEICASLGEHRYLINNAQWQAIAREIEAEPRNLNSGTFNYGHASDPAMSLVASSDDSLGCVGMASNGLSDPLTTDDDCGGIVHINKRTHFLRNDEVIWDFAGNVWEWIRDDIDSGVGSIVPNPPLNNNIWIDFTDSTCGGGTDPCFPEENRLAFGPLNSGLNSTQAVGRIDQGDGFHAGGLIRGGHYSEGSRNGIFAVNFDNNPSDSYGNLGGRCVWTP